MKSGNYLSSQRLTVSTFGVKELNFCVRNGYRWVLFAIITAIAIYLVAIHHATYTILKISVIEDLQLHSKFPFCKIFSLFKLVKIIVFCQ